MEGIVMRDVAPISLFAKLPAIKKIETVFAGLTAIFYLYCESYR